ncbi:MAG: DNA-directed RNA polymerase subunit beta [Candidatus Shapirobacteria bacterium]|nr:DNA-directed RNA polymerase subunit beta [Candidatus Shapirobacteria bacterium]
MISFKKDTGRVLWGKIYKNLPKLDLLSIQQESYRWFIAEGLNQALEEISPINDFTGKNWEIQLQKPTFGDPRHTIEQALSKGLTYDRPLKVEAILTNKKNGKKNKQKVFLGDIPHMTETGTFIINGVERAIVNQLSRSSGAFFSGEVDRASGRMLYTSDIRPLHGSWLEIMTTRNNIINVRVDRRRKFPITTLLRIFGFSTDEEILLAFADEKKANDFLLPTLEKDQTKNRQEALIEFYQKLRPGEPVVLENAQELVENMFFNRRRYNLGKIGRFKINKRLNLEIPNEAEGWTLQKQDLIAIIKYLIKLQNNEGKVDDIDHLSNRRIKRVGEQLTEGPFRIGFLRLERAIKEKMSLFSPEEEVTPSRLVNARLLVASINEFFRSNQLSTILDQTNLLSEIDNLRRISVMGSGGIARERASFSIRDIHYSQYGRICPVRTPEGPNIGLVTYFSLFTKINEYGFLEAPYFKVEKIKDGKKTKIKVIYEAIYLTADDEQKYHITHAGVNVDENGFITDNWVPVRYNGELLEVTADKIDLIDIAPIAVFGTSASLIPFLSHDMPARALMGTHMQCQAVPLINPESPIIGTGMEKVIAQAMKRVVSARHDGKITYVDAEKIVLKKKKKKTAEDTENIKIKGNEETYSLVKFKRTNPYGTCFLQKPLVKVGDEVKVDDLLIDGPCCQNGELALGRNLIIAYCSFQGLEYEDAIVISDRLAKEDVLTSISIEEYETSMVETKLGPEELTRDIPNVSENDLANLAEDGIVIVGSEIGPNDILVGKIAPKGETELTAEERLLRAIFGEKAREVKDTSLRVPHGESGTVIDVQILDRDKGDELEAGAIKKVIVRVAQIRKIMVGDKVAGRHGNKGVISKIVSAADMPFLPDGTPIDIIISPLSVLARMNLGQLFETHLGWAAAKLGYKVAAPVFEKIDEKQIIDELKKAGLPIDGKVRLRDGRTGELSQEKTVVGISYILKLVHMVEDKVHARSTGPYSLVTQQPLGGKAQMGGQRLGEMEVWALEAHRAAYTLQEMLTVKSDDVVGRAKTFEAIVKGIEVPESTIPESFKVLVKELNSLSLDIIPLDTVQSHVNDEEETEVVKMKEEAQVKDKKEIQVEKENKEEEK